MEKPLLKMFKKIIKFCEILSFESLLFSSILKKSRLKKQVQP